MDNQSGPLYFIKMDDKRISYDWLGLFSACLLTRHLIACLFSSSFSTTIQLYTRNSKQVTAADPSRVLNKNVFGILNHLPSFCYQLYINEFFND